VWGRPFEIVRSPRALNILIPFSCPSRGHIYPRKQTPLHSAMEMPVSLSLKVEVSDASTLQTRGELTAIEEAHDLVGRVGHSRPFQKAN
jgi:hypothetical protein